MSFEIIFVLLGLALMVFALIRDLMRPGMILFSVVVLFLCAGVLTPKEMLEGFSNKGMITVALLFLVSEGIRQSGTLSQIFTKFLPKGNTTVIRSQARLLPILAGMSAFLNNTPMVVIFAPIIKRWAEKVKLPPTKFLIPLTYAVSLGGICTLIGTSTNLVVNGMIMEAGYEGLSMFEIGKIGLPIAIVGVLFLILFSNKLLPDSPANGKEELTEADEKEGWHKIEAVLGPRFPGINKNLKEFNFLRHYGAIVKEIKRSGQRISGQLEEVVFQEGDVLTLWGDESFIPTWRESSVFLILSNGKEDVKPISNKKRWFALGLFLFMIAGATIGELPATKEAFPDIKLDMFFFVCVTTIIMAWTKIFPARKYTKYISWDILVTIACAFAISKAIENSGVATMAARYIISLSETFGPYVLLAMTFLITAFFSQLITNNAAAALGFPVALSVATQLGVNPMPFFMVICVAASTSFCTPICYQTNMIVQGIGGYSFMDFVKIGTPLTIIVFLMAVFLAPMIWAF
ncbi:TRAP transporter large permease subunit [Parabacteroides sp. 52]|uniref:SLC13 family permease n=1 Tax=unclassified Parabacteroides TaxID=2649774 RepID=UPI0013D1E7E8|nr:MULTISPECIES: SLC13 family permease [unclassified Parabacteroides]MDH6533936.1 di/tricarboxylate transporter [Parabacteroides sp. PM5-20]NDV54680.1 TRAP transporter large permease subunit [Parabacteroides sp. 52]